MKRPFHPEDSGTFYLIKGSLRDDFEIIAQRKSKEEIDEVFKLQAEVDVFHNVYFVCGMRKVGKL